MTAQMPMCITFEDDFWTQLMWDEDLSDTKIVLKDKEGVVVWEFTVHSIVLRRRSRVFKEIIKSIGEVITFENIDILTLKKFIQFLYVGDIYIETWQEIVVFLELALRYEVDSLLEELESSLIKFLTLINVCDILEVAVRFALYTLETHCMDLIARGAVIVFGTNGFQRLTQETLSKIIADHRLNVVKEIDVIQYLICWAKASAFKEGTKKLDNASLLQRLTPLMKYVRMNKITVEDQAVIPEGLRELIFPPSGNNYSAQVLSSSPIKPQEKITDRLPTQGLCILPYFADVLLRDKKSAISWFVADPTEYLVMRFSVTMPIFLGGFLMSFKANGVGVARLLIRQTLSKTVREPKEIEYSLKQKVCEHSLANEIVGRENYQAACFESETPILLKPNEECNVYLALPDISDVQSEMPRIPLPFTTFKTDEGPTIRMHLDTITAVRKIFFLSACGRCNVNH